MCAPSCSRMLMRRASNSLCGLILQTLPQCVGGRFVDRQILAKHDAVVFSRRFPRHEFLQDIRANALRVALERIAPSSTAAAAHDDVRLHANRLLTSVQHTG